MIKNDFENKKKVQQMFYSKRNEFQLIHFCVIEFFYFNFNPITFSLSRNNWLALWVH